jgi:Dullard-like phosphatase family protein
VTYPADEKANQHERDTYSSLKSPAPLLLSCQISRFEVAPSNRKLILFDLDETLVYSYSKRPDTYVLAKLEDGWTRLGIAFRPFWRKCLTSLARGYDIGVFTASTSNYANPIIDELDRTRSLIKYRLFRDYCTEHNGRYYKDLRVLHGIDLENVLLIDNNALCFRTNLENGIPISTWKGER